MGNTSSVTIPLALNLAIKEGKLNNGDTLYYTDLVADLRI